MPCSQKPGAGHDGFAAIVECDHWLTMSTASVSRSRAASSSVSETVIGTAVAISARCVARSGEPVGEFADAGERGARAAAVSGEIRREHAKAVMREVARLQRPDAVVVF